MILALIQLGTLVIDIRGEGEVVLRYFTFEFDACLYFIRMNKLEYRRSKSSLFCAVFRQQNVGKSL